MSKIQYSFEFFPPKTEELEQKLWQTIYELEPLDPVFVSVTYGAGGSTRSKTHETVAKIRQETSLAPAAHLTCVCATKEEVNQVALEHWDAGVKHIVALRGDAPGEAEYKPHPGGYIYADELVKGLKELQDFEISVAAYPEKHPQAQSLDADIEHLKRKLDAGADRAITQYFFEADTYFKFLEKVQKAGIDKPIIAGIINIVGYKQIVRFSKMCESTIPQWMHEKLEPIKDDSAATKAAAIEITQKLCTDLIAGGVKQFHFYSMNRADMTTEVVNSFRG